MPDAGYEPLHPEGLTWAVLLGRWVDFARASLVLPDDGEGRRVKASVSDIIMLQAVWFALREVEGLSPEQRALGVDRAGLLIERHAGALRRRWGDREMPEALTELIAEAESAWTEAGGGSPG